jgi:acyl dehydratase
MTTITSYPSAAAVVHGVGDDLGPSRWFTVDQHRIDGFATITEDEQWIHIDPVRAETGPYGATIAHGYLTLSLVSPIVMEIFRVDNLHSAVNYGLNKVRFPNAVRAGERIRGRAKIAKADDLGGSTQVTLEVTIEVEGGERPACVAEFIMRLTPQYGGLPA